MKTIKREGFTYKQTQAIKKAVECFDSLALGEIQSIGITFPSTENNGSYEISYEDEKSFDQLGLIIDLVVNLCLDHGV